MGKRANGEGTIVKAGRGRWRVLATVGVLPSGKPRRRSRIVYGSRADAAVALREILRDAGQCEPSRITVVAFLDQWLDVIRHERAENTAVSYGYAVRNHIAPTLGSVRLEAISPLHVQKWLQGMLAAKVGARTRQNAFTVFRAAMGHAVKLRLISENPCTPIDRPKAPRQKILPFEHGQALQILEESAADRLHAVYALAFLTGMRQAELFGLQWKFVDLKAGTLRVELQALDISGRVKLKPPKTAASIRQIELPERCIAALAGHRRRMLREGNASSNLVFSSPHGSFTRRGDFRTRHWIPLLKRLGIQYRGFHHVRHTYATLALGEGVPLHVVSRILGHSKPSTTLNIYSHFLKSHQSQATKAIERLFA